MKHAHTHPFNGPFSGTTRVGRYQKGKTNMDFIEARDSEWQWHQLGHMQVCTLLQTDNHATGRMPFLPPNQQRQSTEGSRNGCGMWVRNEVLIPGVSSRQRGRATTFYCCCITILLLLFNITCCISLIRNCWLRTRSCGLISSTAIHHSTSKKVALSSPIPFVI